MSARPARAVRVSVGRRFVALLRALGALAVLLACLVVAPIVMWRLIGWPLPHHPPSRAEVSAALTRPLDQRLITGVLGCLFWYLYLLLVLSAVTETISRATGWRRPRLPTAGLTQTLSTALVGTIVTGLILAASRSKPAPPGPAVALAAWRAPTVTAAAPADPASAPLAAPSPTSDEQPARSVPVRAHDSLWSLAETHLGDPLRYRELFDLNHGRPQPDGHRLTRPDLIRPGWTLLLPADAAPAAPATTTSTPSPPPANPTPGTHPAGPPTPAVPSPPTPWLPTLPDGPAASTPTPAAPATASPTPATRPAHPAHPDPIRLPSGPVLPVSLLAAIAIAVTVARFLRHRTRPVGQHRGQPADPPLPLIIREILRSGRTLDDPDPDPDSEDTASFDDDLLPAAGPPPDDDPPAGDVPFAPPAMAWPPPYPDLDAPAIPAAPPVPALVGPSPAPDSASATLPVSRPHRAGLRGPTAPTRLPTALRITGGVSLPDPDAARALILTVLAAHHTPAGDDPHHLILSRDAADALHLPAQLLARLRHVTLTPSALDAVTSAEQHLLTRQRLATEHDTATIGPLRAAAPDEHLPPVLLVVTADPALHPRLHALAGRGAALDLHTAALGDWPGQPRWPDPDSTDPDSSWSLRADAAADLLRLLDQATPTDTPTPADSTPSPARAEADPVGLADSTDTADTPAAADPGIETAAVRQDLAPADAASPSLSPSHDETVTPTPETRDANGDRPPPAPAEAPADTGGVLLVLLDRPHLLRDGDTVYQGRLGLEIAGFLALHRRPATTATLMAALLPDIDPDKAKDQIYQAIRRLREALRRAGADGVLLSDRNGYRLTDTLAVDAWDIDRALSAADTASDDTGRAAALHTATSLYTGRLLDGSEWATAHATELEHRMIDATADLADLLADDDPTAATRVLEHATTTLFPYTETLYTHLMRLHAAAGHPGDIHRAYRRLLTRLADLGTTPSPETDRLLARLTRPRHDPPPV